MRKFIIEDKRDIPPFNEPARELRVLNKPLWLAQRDALAAYCDTEIPVESLNGVPDNREEMIVHRDNLYFDEPFVDEFIKRARKTAKPCRAAFSADDKAFVTYALPMSHGFKAGSKRDETGKLIRDDHGKEITSHYEMDLWYFPQGYQPDEQPVPIVVSSDYAEAGYYS